MNQKIIWVDIYDNEIGYGDKLDTHKNNILHRAFSVFIINNNRMLLQKRAADKYHSGGLWANACCSHPSRGESTSIAAQRRLNEELGIRCDLKEIDSFIYFSDYGTLSEYEYDHVFLGEYDGDLTINKEEIEEVQWVDMDFLENELIQNPKKFTSWFLIACHEVIKTYKANKIVTEGVE